MDAEAELKAANAAARRRLDARMLVLTSGLHCDGRADRAALGKPDPTLTEVLRGVGEPFRRLAAALRGEPYNAGN